MHFLMLTTNPKEVFLVNLLILWDVGQEYYQPDSSVTEECHNRFSNYVKNSGAVQTELKVLTSPCEPEVLVMFFADRYH